MDSQPAGGNNERGNSLDDLVSSAVNEAMTAQQTISQGYTLAASSHGAMISLDRMLLTESYLKQGLVQTLVNQPVEDAFQGGFDIVSGELSPDDIKLLMDKLNSYEWTERSEKMNEKLHKRGPEPEGDSEERENEVIDDPKMRSIVVQSAGIRGQSDIETIKDVAKWARLFGGGALIVNTEGNFQEEFRLDDVTEDSPVEFIAADRWETILSATNIWDRNNPTPFNYYGFPLHYSRVILVPGVRAPSYARQRLQGWGMSEVERCIRPINAFVKFETMLFELVDEAKVDVYNIYGFTDSLGSAQGVELQRKRIFMANQLKNYNNAVVMDKEDKFDHKQINFTGLAEIWDQLRINLSSALRIPMNKLFGQSASGFSSGQDSIENYNSIVQGVRQSIMPLMAEAIKVRCMQLFGYVPKFSIRFKPLKVLSGLEEEQVLDLRQNRILALADRMFLSTEETMTMLRNQNVISMETEAERGERDPIGDKEEMAEMGLKTQKEGQLDGLADGVEDPPSRTKRGPISAVAMPKAEAKMPAIKKHAAPVSRRDDSR